jgi:hypothetical protein
MLAKLSIPEPEHIHGIEPNPVARRRITKESMAGMSAGYGIVDKNQIPISHDLVDGCTEVRDCREKTYVKFDKPGFPLRGILIVLHVVVVHESIYRGQIALAKNLFIEFPHYALVLFCAHPDSFVNGEWQHLIPFSQAVTM